MTPIALALHAVLIGAALSVTAMPQAQAQAVEERDVTREFDIPAGSLDQVLGRFGQAAGVMVAIDPALTAGIRSPGLRGVHSVRTGLAALLDPHDLEAVAGTAGGHRLRRRSADRLAPEPSGVTLPAVTIKAARAPAGELPALYAGGQIARGGRVGVLGNKDVMDIPFNVTNYTSQVIADQQARTLADVLASDPSVRATTSAGHGMETFRVRGFDLWMGDLAFNGMYGLAPDGHAATELFERVEVLRGPSALLSGMAPGGSVGGSVNLVPKRAGDSPLTRVTGTYVGDANVGVHVDVARRFGEDRDLGIRANGVVSDGRTGVSGQTKRRQLGAVALDYRGSGWRASADAYANEDEQRGGSVFMASFASSIPQAPDGDTNVFRGAENAVQNKALVGRVEVDIATDWTAYAALGRRLHDYSGFLRGTYVAIQPNGDFASTHRNYRGYSRTTSAETGARGDVRTGSLRHTIVVSLSGLTASSGLSYGAGAAFTSNIYNPVAPVLAESAGPAPKTGESTLTSLALADTVSMLNDTLQVTLGLRHQRVRSESFNAAGGTTSAYDRTALTPALGLVSKPWQAPVSLYANYIEGLSQGGTVTDVLAANYLQVFAPYKTQQAELGVKWDQGRFLNTFSVFQITKPSLVKNFATTVYSDDGEQRNRGIEWTTAGEVVPGVRVLGGASYTQAVQTRTAGAALDGNRAFGVPSRTANVGAEWDTSMVPQLTLTGRLTYTGSQYLNSTNTQQVPGFTVADLGARYSTKVNERDIVLRASIHNVFNRRYWLGGFGDGYAQVGVGRLVLLSGSVDF